MRLRVSAAASVAETPTKGIAASIRQAKVTARADSFVHISLIKPRAIFVESALFRCRYGNSIPAWKTISVTLPQMNVKYGDTMAKLPHTYNLPLHSESATNKRFIDGKRISLLRS
ncbi:hypothetical protein AGR7A_Lc120455 [Agrobacterium deltaense NCPPB 1641]|uniref:Uncharacterized protein n=1 Tax=Agrobacterium deltaense NCPPB 1641 TaxID=1183425 RepID=A0A1S7TXE8_9HYPH|nr:hypothetical protein AGR7A_Lc120455 [Agrobacterium deltaense NCPPB 1641]